MTALEKTITIGLFLAWSTLQALGDSGKDQLKSEFLPDCQACKLLVDSFKKGLDRTSRYKFEGGDATWEESKLGKYAESEVRLTEIEEELCKDVVKGQLQCHKLASDNEENFERWWISEQKQYPELFDWLCIQTTAVCCPENMYGPDCAPCPGGVQNPCSGNGKCRGSGTRKGTGECRCHRGYSGKECHECSVGFYAEQSEEKGLLCQECHRSCKGRCADGTSKGCEACNDGWLHHPELGCQDIDECLSDSGACPSAQFCVNTEGSYRCIDCHSSCASCYGDAPDECIQCKEGYTRRGNLCIDSDEWWRTIHTQWGRYLTYAGLCIATFIILKKSVFVASIVGLAVAAYIGVSEYIVSGQDGATPAVHLIPTSTN